MHCPEHADKPLSSVSRDAVCCENFSPCAFQTVYVLPGDDPRRGSSLHPVQSVLAMGGELASSSTSIPTTDPNRGLTETKVHARRARFGPNELPQPQSPALWRLALAQVTHLFALLLWIAAASASIAGMTELALAIVAVILLNGTFAFIGISRRTSRSPFTFPSTTTSHRASRRPRDRHRRERTRPR